MQVITRDDRIVDFNIERIYKAIDKAFRDVEKTSIPEDLKEKVEDWFLTNYDIDHVFTIEEIQDIVENFLMREQYYAVAKGYILYRNEHAENRILNERIEYMDEYGRTNANAATASETDANANVSVKNVANLNGEVWKTRNRKIQRLRMRKKLKEMYPELEQQYEKDLEHHIIYTHDEASFPVVTNYCMAVSMWPFLLHGSSDMDGLGSKAPTNLQAFCGQFGNLVFLNSAQCKGACLYKDQKLILKDGNYSYSLTSKEIFDKYSKNKKIKTFVNNNDEWEYVDTSDLNLSVPEDGKMVKVNKVFRRKYNGPIKKIKYYAPRGQGNYVYVTEDHLFKQILYSRIFEQKSKYLQPNDTIFANKDYSYLVNANNKEWKKGWLIGLICGDGCISVKNRINISVNNEQAYLVDIIQKYSKEIYGFNYSVSDGHKCIQLQKTSIKHYAEIHKEIIGENTYDKHINVNEKTLDFQLGFLDGLFCADGSYSQNRGIIVALANSKLIDNINDIIDNLNITHPKVKVIEAKNNKSTLYSLYVPISVLKYLVHTHNKVIQRKECHYVENHKREQEYHYGYNAFRGTRSSIGPGYIKSWTKSKNGKNYKTEVIESIEEFQNDHEFVYEIETETHWYNCGGFIVHNCAYGEFFNAMDYYCTMDWGKNYHEKMEDIVMLEPMRTRRQMLHQYFQQIVYTINQPAGNRCYQSPFTNFSYYDRNYWHAVFEDFVFPDGTRPEWERVSFLQKEFIQWLNRERTKTLLTFPVETMALLSDGHDIKDKEYKAFTAKMYAEGHSFFTYISDNPDSLASCCRLRNEIQENVFSFTNGLTGVQTGSANVITLNMSRIIQDWANKNEYSREWLSTHFLEEETKQSFKKYLETILERVYAYQITYKTMLYEVEANGLLTASNAGYISMRKLYSTIGINGVNEAAEFIGMKCNYNEPYKQFCRLVTGTISTQNKLHSKDPRFLFNCEFVPAEGLGSKNYNWDKEDGYWVPEGRVLYNSYFYLADDTKTNVLEKFKLHGREFTELLDGGVGLHCNLVEHLSQKQYERLIDVAIKNGTSYFTFNIPNSECTNPECHHIIKQPLDSCPKCGSRMRQWTRVVGYLRPVDNFDQYRKIEAERRFYAPGTGE